MSKLRGTESEHEAALWRAVDDFYAAIVEARDAATCRRRAAAINRAMFHRGRFGEQLRSAGHSAGSGRLSATHIDTDREMLDALGDAQEEFIEPCLREGEGDLDWTTGWTSGT